jgi:type I restriction enzyme S subunit
MLGSLAKPVHVPNEAAHWSVRDGWHHLDTLCKGVFDCPHTTPNLSSDGPYVVRSQDIRTGIFRLSEAGRVSEETYQERIARAEPQHGDLLYSREGTYFGIAAEVPANIRVCLGQRMVLIRPDPQKLDYRFLRYWLNSPLMARHIEGFRDGTVAERLNMPVIRALPVPALDRKLQTAIGFVLGALDDKIELNRRMNETLEAMARAVFKDWFVDFGPTRAKMDGRAPYLSSEIWSLFPDRLDDEGKPEDWELKPVANFAELRGGKQLDKSRISESGPIPVFGGAGIMGYTTEHNADGFVISVGRVGAYCGQFFAHRGKAWINNNASLISQRGGVAGEWLFEALKNANIDVIKKGAAQPFVSNSDVAALNVIWPGHRVINQFADVLIPLALQREANDAGSTTLVALRDLLLPKLMSGEIRIEDAEKMAGEAA